MEKDWFDIALKHFDKINYSQALIAINIYIEENPDNKNGKLLKAVICRGLSNYYLSLTILEDIAPSDNDIKGYKLSYYRELADTYEEMGQFQKACIWYDKFIELTPDSTSGYIFKGACLAAAGHYQQAKAEHLKATVLEGDKEEAFYNLALIYRAEMDFVQAKFFCEKSLEIDPDDKDVINCYKDIIAAINLATEYGS